MGKKKKGGPRRSGPPRPRPVRTHPDLDAPSRKSDRVEEDQDLFAGLRTALRSEKPLDLLALVSGILTVADPRTTPFTSEPGPVVLNDLVESFIETPYAETTAALTAVRALVTDELLAARIGRELAGRNHPLPSWLRGLDQAQVEPDVWFLSHVLGDGDDFFLGVRLPSGHALSALVYVDHNLGGVVKDAFVVPEPVTSLLNTVRGTLTGDDQTLTRTDPAQARAAMEEAIAHGARMVPPLESDSWPMCRPLVEWMIRQLPAGGEVAEPVEWTEEATDVLAESFLGSELGADFDDHDHRGLLTSLLWFGTDYAGGDPLRWSPVNVEILLADWFPRKVLGEPAFLAKLPGLLRAFIRYAHAQRGIRDDLTKETLAAVDALEPDYQRTIRSSRPTGPAALVASLLESGMIGPGGLDELGGLAGLGGLADLGVGPDALLNQLMRSPLEKAVGGHRQLENLDAEPLPDEAFEWAGIADDIRPVVQEMLETCDRCAEELLDVEHRTAMRRFLSRAAVGDPAVFRRKASPLRGAAAIAWVIGRANDSVSGGWSTLTAQQLLAWFGIKGSVSQRAQPLLRAFGADGASAYDLALGTPDVLVSARRAAIIERRDRWFGV